MLNGLASLTMSTSILKALSGKLDIKIHSPSILYIPGSQHLLLLRINIYIITMGSTFETFEGPL